jgi:hypothetical protein
LASRANEVVTPFIVAVPLPLVAVKLPSLFCVACREPHA